MIFTYNKKIFDSNESEILNLCNIILFLKYSINCKFF